MITRKILLSSIVLAFIAAIGFAPAASADQITLGANTSGSFDFTGNGMGAITIDTPFGPISGPAHFQADTGTYTLGSTSFTTGTISGGAYPANGFQSFAYSALDGDSLSGTIHWTSVKDNGFSADLIGTLTNTSVSGDSAFTSSFGNPVAIDIATGGLSSHQSLAANAAFVVSGFAQISGGNLVGQSVPEPMTLLLLGSGLVGLAITRRRIE